VNQVDSLLRYVFPQILAVPAQRFLGLPVEQRTVLADINGHSCSEVLLRHENYR
jgi:hypothetical protein